MGYLYVETMLPARQSQRRQYTGNETERGMALLHWDDYLRNGPLCAEHMTGPGTGGLRQGPALAQGNT